MTNPRVVGDAAPNASGDGVIVVEWDPGTVWGAELGRDYFEAGVLPHGSSDPRTSFQVTGDRQITINVSDLRLYLETVSNAQFSSTVKLGFQFKFPGRGGFVACTKGGPATYTLLITIEYALEAGTWTVSVAV